MSDALGAAQASGYTLPSRRRFVRRFKIVPFA